MVFFAPTGMSSAVGCHTLRPDVDGAMAGPPLDQPRFAWVQFPPCFEGYNGVKCLLGYMKRRTHRRGILALRGHQEVVNDLVGGWFGRWSKKME